ncbi:Oligopeptide transport system permease protein OppC [Bifidobacterium leontopitheci]|uniref:Oligopeptide transport system permease protein OppC n=1 Tax=Bifidobacterium leontopitheci TaxID=2650774 RepID=A0A6I1GFB2_9BIFI|nr:Oligopeptide transport system permease protein OppC [Bifidobacterium leontopitheci]
MAVVNEKETGTTVKQSVKQPDGKAAARAKRPLPLWRRHLRDLMQVRAARIAVFFLIFMLLFSFIGPLFSPYGQNQLNVRFAEQAPTIDHWLGTDDYGRDVLTRLMYAGRISMTIGIASTVLSMVLGALIGVASGYFGGWIDAIIMRFADLLMSIPSLPLLIIMAALLSAFDVPPDTRIYYVMVMLSVIGWPGIARMIRGEVLSLREELYMKATEALGLSTRSRLFHHLMPNVYPLLIVQTTLSVAGGILMESTLSFLGLGVMPPNASWGNMMAVASNLMDFQKRPWLWIPPGTAVFVTVVCINVLGDRIRDVVDPRAKEA